MLIKERRSKEAEGVLISIFKSRNKSYGGEHHATLMAMGQLADLLRDMCKDDEADEMEKRIIAIGEWCVCVCVRASDMHAFACILGRPIVLQPWALFLHVSACVCMLAGKQLLRYTKIDKFKSLSYVTNYLAARDHLLDKAAMFLAKAYITFKDKLVSAARHTHAQMCQLKAAELFLSHGTETAHPLSHGMAPYTCCCFHACRVVSTS